MARLRALVTGVLVAVAALGGARGADAQVSPGPLAAPHRSLEGNRACFQCHPPAGAKDRMDDRCLACHGEIAALRAAKRGFHARVEDRACAKCHPDHGGADFRMVEFEEGSPEKFDHERSGYALEGAHAKVECRACHQPRNQTAAGVAKMKVKDRSRSWLGLDPACASCHGDPHRGQLGLGCAKCHTLATWKPASSFDHARSRYPLTGKHAKVECAKCHLAPGVSRAVDAKGQPVPQWKPLAYGECSSCHKDPHAGRFGGACAKCHVTEDWKRINTATFDHEKTRYPLRGAHAAVACAKCHDPKTGGSAKPAFGRCDACHRDAHAGQTARRAAGAAVAVAPDCAACHEVRAWSPSIYALAAHQTTGYPLAGAHAKARCAGCHGKAPATQAAVLGPARIPLHPNYRRCLDCHGDPHGSRFEPGGARARAESCVACHGIDRFSPSTFDARAHDRATYALEGAHRAVPCAACHKELEAAGAATGANTLRGVKSRPLGFADARRRCAECHRSPHGEQFAARRDKGACESCHGLAAFAPAERFDHDRDASYKLDGAHRKVPCAGCHPTVVEAGVERVVYRPVASRCESCHAVIPVPSKEDSSRAR